MASLPTTLATSDCDGVPGETDDKPPADHVDYARLEQLTQLDSRCSILDLAHVGISVVPEEVFRFELLSVRYKLCCHLADTDAILLLPTLSPSSFPLRVCMSRPISLLKRLSVSALCVCVYVFEYLSACLLRLACQ